MIKYKSTRDIEENELSSAQAIIAGLAFDGGLYYPSIKPKLEINKYINLSYKDLTMEILKLYFPDLSLEGIKDNLYNKFTKEEVVELVKLGDDYLLELFHGPTYAFKDLALQVLPLLMSASINKENNINKIHILTATSGDTGKAALVGFMNQKNIKITVLYPKDKVSKIQELLMNTQDGDNVEVYQVEGNFDDCQKMVKTITNDKELREILADRGVLLSSANSINIGRLIPQIVYYLYSYLKLLKSNEIKVNEEIDFIVPTGNFGNILAGYYAKEMGLPIRKLICASNSNNVLTEFINSGHYNARREFYTTSSPSMDILVSSNVERLLFELSNHDSKAVNNFQENLEKNGEFTLDNNSFKKLQELFVGVSINEEKTHETIKNVYSKYGYVLDPHSAVAYAAKVELKLNKAVVVCTASPVKFPKTVINAIEVSADEDEFLNLNKLSSSYGIEIPEELKDLANKEVRFTKTITYEELKENFINGTNN